MVSVRICLFLAGVTVFASPAKTVDTYDFVEVTAPVSQPDAANCFTGASLTGSFGGTKVEGFCDSADGSVFRIRFLPSKPGHYDYPRLVPSGPVREELRGRLRRAHQRS